MFVPCFKMLESESKNKFFIFWILQDLINLQKKFEQFFRQKLTNFVTEISECTVSQKKCQLFDKKIAQIFFGD